jgi:hypothetical protein
LLPYHDFHLCGNIAVQTCKQVTQPEPFQLESVMLHEAAQADLKQKMKNDTVQEVRARPSLTLPFMAHKANTELFPVFLLGFCRGKCVNLWQILSAITLLLN